MKCRHDKLRDIYGDEIIAAGYNRSQCVNCHKLFKELSSTRDNNSQVRLRQLECLLATLKNPANADLKVGEALAHLGWLDDDKVTHIYYTMKVQV